MCQWFKNRKTLYGRLQPKKTTELKSWDSVHVDLIGPYSKSIRQQHPIGAIVKNNFSLTCMAIIDSATGWFEIVKLPMYDINEVMCGNYEYIDKSSARVSQFFYNTWLSRYMRLCKVVFDN